MARRKTTAAAIIVTLAIAAAIGWLCFSPQWTLQSMRRAASDGDVATIDAHIDYDALRSSLKTQLTESIRRQAASAGGGEAGAKLALVLASGQIDRLVSQASVRAMIAGAKDAKDTGMMRDSRVEVTRTGLTTFVAGTPNATGTPGGAEFTLEGLTWRITGVRIPEAR